MAAQSFYLFYLWITSGKYGSLVFRNMFSLSQSGDFSGEFG